MLTRRAKKHAEKRAAEEEVAITLNQHTTRAELRGQITLLEHHKTSLETGLLIYADAIEPCDEAGNVDEIALAEAVKFCPVTFLHMYESTMQSLCLAEFIKHRMDKNCNESASKRSSCSSSSSSSNSSKEQRGAECTTAVCHCSRNKRHAK